MAGVRVQQAWVDAAEACADVAAAAVRPWFRAGVAADTKGDQSPVTVADRTAELAMRAVLSQRLPDHGIMGEEFGAERPEADLQWVLDPLDGTRAFITGRPTFGTLVALLAGGVPVLGVIDQPVSGERWVGVAGERTRFRGGVGRVGTRACPRLADAELSATSPEMFGADLPRFRRLQDGARRTSWGGDCYAYGLLALGGIDVIAEADLKPWDWAAVLPVVEGAGGRVTGWDGAPLRLDGDGRVLAVGDPALQDAAIALLEDHP